ncbi:Coiled-coil domain-containing protein 81 [Sparganum proliferum]
MKLCSGEGLKLPKIGTFSFCPFDDHALGYSNRAKGKPCFYVSSWLCHQCDLKQVGSLVPSSIKYKTLNMLTVADNLEIERTKVENLLKRLCLSLQRDIISKKSAVLDFVKIGRLRVIGNVASFKFFKGFVQQLNDQTNAEVGDGQISVESSVLDTNSTANFPSLCNESQLNTFSIDYECPSTNLDASFASLNRKTHSPEAEVQSDSQTESGRCQMQIRNALNNKNEPDCANAKGSDLSLLQDEDEAWESRRRTFRENKGESGSQSTTGRTSRTNRTEMTDSHLETLSCGHSRAAGQELCYLCHQKVSPINQKNAVLDTKPSAQATLSQGSRCHLETQTGPSNQVSTRSLFRRKHHILYPMACYIDRNRPETPTKESRQAAFKAQLDQQMELHLAARDAMQDYLCQLESLEAEAVNRDLNQISLNKNREKLEKQADYKTALEYQIDLGSTSSSIY